MWGSNFPEELRGWVLGIGWWMLGVEMHQLVLRVVLRLGFGEFRLWRWVSKTYENLCLFQNVFLNSLLDQTFLLPIHFFSSEITSTNLNNSIIKSILSKRSFPLFLKILALLSLFENCLKFSKYCVSRIHWRTFNKGNCKKDCNVCRPSLRGRFKKVITKLNYFWFSIIS